jgi:hypothetical protein
MLSRVEVWFVIIGLVLVFTTGGLGLAQSPEKVPFKPLFDGKSLDGWEQKNGEARYEVKNGVIIGTSVPDTPNSFLCTKKHYSDFVLELEFKVDEEMNSGVQIRSNAYDKDTTIKVKSSSGEIRERTFPAGRVHGYQLEIDPSDRAWTAGIYDEGRRGWLNDLSENEAARSAFRQGEWNKLKVEAIGSSIKTWLNGVPAADLDDDMTPSGFIALQVHGVGSHPERVGQQVRWRKIQIKDLSD